MCELVTSHARSSVTTYTDNRPQHHTTHQHYPPRPCRVGPPVPVFANTKKSNGKHGYLPSMKPKDCPKLEQQDRLNITINVVIFHFETNLRKRSQYINLSLKLKKWEISVLMSMKERVKVTLSILELKISPLRKFTRRSKHIAMCHLELGFHSKEINGPRLVSFELQPKNTREQSLYTSKKKEWPLEAACRFRTNWTVCWSIQIFSTTRKNRVASSVFLQMEKFCFQPMMQFASSVMLGRISSIRWTYTTIALDLPTLVVWWVETKQRK